jgi:phage shock protein PspC (stress-responsive transcriptional regulator)
MKKVININFQGRVIPIEETAYELLQNYISSLRNYFANEEGRDEIINDIESRIGELFDEKLKKGASCIMDTDVENIMHNMGRPEDFEKEEEGSGAKSSDYQQTYTYAQPGAEEPQASKKRLYRDEEDKILGGVASGLAHYLGIDPAVVRIIFAILAIVGGSGFLVYIILWIVLPSRSLVTNIRKRLYRDTDDRVIAGVCGGLGKYFDINPAIPRIIFAAPFIFGIITSIGRSFFDVHSVFVGSFGGGTFILVYIILWIVLPEAKTASEKLEMKGEKVDLHSIRNTVMGDLQGVKGRAEKMGSELKSSAQRFASEAGSTIGTGARNVVSDTSSSVKRGGGLANALAILIKAFVFLVAGAILIGLFIGLIVLLGSGVEVMPLRDFMLQGPLQNFFAWGTVLLFIGVPVLALIVWFIRRLMRVRAHNKYIGYSFTALWFIGLFCLIGLISSVSRNFRSQVGIRQDINLVQPANGKLLIEVGKSDVRYFDTWVDVDGILSVDKDSLFLNTARVNIIQSKDSLYHVHLVKVSRGHDREQATELAEKIDFRIDQIDSVISLPETFTVSRNQKWRNQRVLVVIEVPVGKQIRMDPQVRDYDYFNIDFNNRRNWRMDWERGWEYGEDWRSNVDMTMTKDGLKWRDEKRDNEDNDNEYHYDDNNLPVTPGAPLSPDSLQKLPADSLKKISTYYRVEDGDDMEENDDATEVSLFEVKTVELPSTRISNPLGTILRIR